MGLEPVILIVDVSVAIRFLGGFGNDITQCKICATGKYELMFTIRFGKKTLVLVMDHKIRT
tara:strand:+ start:272 stop:454 length:183 start_codon:yes stop_codon:yes gene_type:complete